MTSHSGQIERSRGDSSADRSDSRAGLGDSSAGLGDSSASGGDAVLAEHGLGVDRSAAEQHDAGAGKGLAVGRVGEVVVVVVRGKTSQPQAFKMFLVLGLI